MGAQQKLNANGLTDREQAFCDAYIADPDHNATKAAIAAGYSARSARSQASRMLTKANIRTYIDKKLAELTNRAMKRFEITNDRILQELATMAFLDIADLIDEDGQFLPMNEIPEHARRAIVGMDFEELFDFEKGQRKQIGQVRKVKLGDKKGALELLGKNLKMWTDRMESEFTQVNFNVTMKREPRT